MGAIGPLELVIVIIVGAVTWILSGRRFEDRKTVIRVVVITIVAIASVIGLTGRKKGENPARLGVASADAGSIELRLKNLSARLNQSLPMSVDGTTVLESTSTDGKTFTYRYYLTGDASTFTDSSQLEAAFRPVLKEKACRSPEIVDLLSRGAVFRHRYADESGRPLGDVFVTDADCR